MSIARLLLAIIMYIFFVSLLQLYFTSQDCSLFKFTIQIVFEWVCLVKLNRVIIGHKNLSSLILHGIY